MRKRNRICAVLVLTMLVLFADIGKDAVLTVTTDDDSKSFRIDQTVVFESQVAK